MLRMRTRRCVALPLNRLKANQTTMKNVKYILSALALVGAGASAGAADIFVHRVPSQANCAATGCSALSQKIFAKTDTTPSQPTPEQPITPTQLRLSAPSLDFGPHIVNEVSGYQVVTVFNEGSAPAVVTGTAILGTTKEFRQSNACGSMLIPGATCEINVDFSPKARGLRTDSLVVTTATQTLSVGLSGTGLQAAGTLTAAATDLGVKQVGTLSAMSVTFTNTGDATLKDSYATATGGITIAPGFTTTCGTEAKKVNIAPGGTCRMSIRYAREQEGTMTGTASIIGETLAQPVSLGFTGSAVKVPLAISTPTMDFGNMLIGESESRSAIITNTSAETLAINSILSNNSDAKVTENCGKSLPAGASCNVTVQLVASNVGPLTTNISINTALGFQFISVSYSGSPMIVAQNSANFTGKPDELASYQTVTLKNLSKTTSYYIPSYNVSGGYNFRFSMPGTTCVLDKWFAPGESCDLVVSYYGQTVPEAGAVFVWATTPNLTAIRVPIVYSFTPE